MSNLETLTGDEFGLDSGAEDIALQMYTSGSSGRPKGVLLSHRALLHNMRAFLEGRPAVDAITVVGAPLFHMNGLLSSLFMLARGGTVCLLERFDARRYLHAVARRRATIMVGVPTMFALILNARDQEPNLDLSSVRNIFPGSAPLSEELRRKLEAAFPLARVQNTYGTTEAFGMFGADPEGRPTPPGSVGSVQRGVEVRLVGGSSPGEGRLIVRTPSSMAGYHKNDGATADKLHDGWYDTGDLVREVNGFYYILGRADDMIICGGENIYPSQVESLLETHPLVRTAAVVAVPDRQRGEIPVAFVVPRPGQDVDADELKSFALQHGPAYAHPRHIAVVSELPMTSSGKIDKRKLAEQAPAEFRPDTRGGAE
jgi:long-chain acyl-CoA synthetase